MNSEEKIVEKTWNDSTEKVIKNIGESCKGYKWINIRSAERYSKYNDYPMYLAMFCSGLSGIMSSINEEENNLVLKTLSVSFSFFSALLTGIVQFSHFEKRMNSHKSIGSKYASLEANIRRQLQLPRTHRIPCSQYIEWVTKSYDELFESSPLIPQDIYNDWISFAKDNGMNIPNEVTNEIEINMDEEREKMNTLSSIRNIDSKNEVTVEIIGEKKKVKRNMNSVQQIELNRFTDGRMKYELKRLYGFH